jgi:DNA-binding CsgD family transcriptional regulator
MPSPRLHVPPSALAATLHRPLLALHAALEVESLWKAVRAVLRTAFSPHRVTLFLGHLGMSDARVVFTDPPIDRTEEWYNARGRLNPFSPYIDSHRGVRFYRFSDVLPSRKTFIESEFYRSFAEPEGWDKGVSALYWSRREVTSMFSLYRAPHQPEFSDAEMALLRYLHPFIGTAIERIQRLHTERLARRSLEEFNRHLPVGLMLLDWDLRVEFANPEAQRTCTVWNLGPEAGRVFNPRDTFAVPAEVLEACRSLRASLQERDSRPVESFPNPALTVDSTRPPELRAHVTVLNTLASALAKPRFLVVLDARPVLSGERAAVSPERFGRLRELTPREREIALLVCEGASNAEIAARLSKSVLTIKTQLNAVFRKLGVGSRTRLIALLR